MKTKFLSVTVLAALLFAGCSSEDEKIDNQEPQPVRFSTAIHKAEGVQKTRAADDAWAAGDAIGVFMVGNGSTAIAENAVNRKYTTKGGDSFTADAGQEVYYPMDGSPVDFIAYYPYADAKELGVPIDVKIETTQTADNQPAFDLLYAQADNSGSGYTKTSDVTVPLQFEHKLTKLIMNTTADTGVDTPDLKGMTISIKGMNTESTFNLSDGALGTADKKADIAPRTITDGELYDAIILPGNYSDGDITVEFTINPTGSKPETFVWNIGDIAFEAAKEYSYEVKLTRTEVEVTGTITDWKVEDKGEVTAE